MTYADPEETAAYDRGRADALAGRPNGAYGDPYPNAYGRGYWNAQGPSRAFWWDRLRAALGR